MPWIPRPKREGRSALEKTRGALLLLVVLGTAACGGDPTEGLDPLAKRRYVRLDGAHNFRDLGGYAARDGRTVRWGLFFRSDQLSELSDADLEVVSKLGIRLVCDFRGPDERAEAPDRLPEESPPQVAELEISDPSFQPGKLREQIASGADVDLRQLLIDANRLFATTFAPRYRAMFERITLADNLPALVHCTAGKDRAGFASALILRVLGVPMGTVYEDFLLTNAYTAARNERRILAARIFSLGRVKPETLRPVLGVEREYLEAAFSAIDEEHGSFERYRREALGLDDEEVEAFRSLVLERT